jgi:protein involved in polysaccharide export with SLBB domain
MLFTLRSSLLVLLLLVADMAPAAAQAVDSTSAASLSPGDVIRIAVWRKPEYSGDFIVAADSTITHPLYRELKVVGLPFRAVEERLRAFLLRYETAPAFVISPLLRIFVGGEVRQPSVYTVPPGTTIAQAVALAGGPTERGRLEEVALVRNERRATLDLMRADTHASIEAVRSGDQVIVGRRIDFFRDVLAPASSVVAALAGVMTIIIQTHR